MNRPQKFILRSLAAGPRTLWDLVAEQNTQHRRFNESLRELLDQSLVQSDRSGTIRLTHHGWRDVQIGGLSKFSDHRCPTCHGRGVTLESLAGLQSEYLRIVAGRPVVTTEFDQGVVPTAVALARVALMEQRGDLANKDILILGDDDLMCVALKVHGRARRVVVLEVDGRVTEFLRKVVRLEGWDDVEIIEYDARKKLPEQLSGQFDVFFTDPVETVGGIRLFLSRCAAALRDEGGAGYFGLTHIESGWAKWLGVQRDVLEMNFAIDEVLKDFSQYVFLGDDVLRSKMKLVRDAPVPLQPPERLWYSSSLFRLQAVGKPQPKILDDVDWGRELYADEDTI